MSAEILNTIEKSGVDRLGLAPEEPSRKTGDGDGAELPTPPTLKNVVQIAKLYEVSKAYMASAKEKLQTPPLPTDVDWELSLYMLFCAWIVNFGLDPKSQEDTEQPSKSKQEIAGTRHRRQQEYLIIAAAAVLGLTWIPFVDLALAPFSDDENAASGPFGGVFVSHGEKPFMILAFKGTTFSIEVNTDKMRAAVQVCPEKDVLYGELAHKGISQGLFIPFTHVGEKHDAFEIIWELLHAEAHKLQFCRGDAGEKIPLYVTGHSLGAGYATLACIELIRRIGLAEPTSFALYDTWVFGAPRVVLNAGAKKARSVLRDPIRHFYRPARHHDPAPTLPGTVGNNTYIHLDIGYKLSPESPKGDYVSVRSSEIDEQPMNDDSVSWVYHKPPRYYEGIMKVLDPQVYSEHYSEAV